MVGGRPGQVEAAPEGAGGPGEGEDEDPGRGRRLAGQGAPDRDGRRQLATGLAEGGRRGGAQDRGPGDDEPGGEGARAGRRRGQGRGGRGEEEERGEGEPGPGVGQGSDEEGERERRRGREGGGGEEERDLGRVEGRRLGAGVAGSEPRG